MSAKLPFFARLGLAWRVLTGASDASAASAAPPSLVSAAPDAALQLLAILQREGRLIDFLQEDVDGFSDAEVAGAARVVHQGCRKALREHVTLAAVSERDEGSRVTLEAGFDSRRYRLAGKVVGEPPFSGTLVHRGWVAESITLPARSPEHDATVLAPAEVEL